MARNVFLWGGAPDNAPNLELMRQFTSEVLRTESKKLLYIPIAMPETTYKGVEYTYAMMHEA